MADYGHDLTFGSSITPTAAAPQQVVALAQAPERAGLDLVTFQDHPYQSRFLDTWILLSYVAAQTERVHVSANVLNLPLRAPAVLAARPPASICSAEDASSLAWGPGRSGTPSTPWVDVV